MINEIISDLIKIELAHVFQFEKNGEVVLYNFDSDSIFDSKNFGGYLRQIKSTKIEDANVTNYYKTDYKLVLFFNPNRCFDDIKNILANVESIKRIGNITSIKVRTFYLDSVLNMKQEKLKGLNKKVIIADIEVNEIICKTSINC
jgi:hypothetical protein